MGYHRATFSVGSVTAIDSATPAQTTDVATVQGITLEFKSTEVPLRGNELLPLDAAVSEVEITGKIESADSLAVIVPIVIPGTTTATGRAKMAVESSVIPATPFIITVTNSATFRKDLGVVNLTTGKRITSSPAANQYSVAAGAYTFASAEGTVRIRYSYNDATTGITTTWQNQAVGATAGYGLEVYEPTGGTREAGYFFPAVKFQNASGGLSPKEWNKTSVDFTVYADSTGKGFDIFSDE
jgi:hypothetical protein